MGITVMVITILATQIYKKFLIMGLAWFVIYPFLAFMKCSVHSTFLAVEDIFRR